MANYANLKAAIDTVIKANGQQEITGTVLNQTLTAMVNSLGAGYLFMGVAIPSTNPGTPDQNVFYLAGQAGTYSNFGAITLQAGLSILKWNGTWSSETLFTFDASITQNSANPITSGAVFAKMKIDGGAYDVSAHNNNQTFASLSALLSDANLSTIIPTNIRSGGMSIKFIQSSDNKYVQYRYMGTATTSAAFTNVANWQGADDVPTAGSPNFVKSDGLYNSFQNIDKQLGGLIKPLLTKGTFTANAPYNEQNSNYALRTDFLEYEYFRNAKVNSPYNITYYYYNSEKVGLYKSTTLSPYSPGTSYKYVRILVKGGTGTADTWGNIGLTVKYSNSITDRLSTAENNANYSQYDAFLEQGGFAFSNGAPDPGPSWIRTRYLTYNFIGKVSIGSGFTVRAFYYGQNRTHISNAELTFTDGVCKIPTVADAVYIAFAIKYTAGGNISPSDVDSLRLYPKWYEFSLDPVKLMRSYALVNILEQGSLVHATGYETESTKYVRTPYIPYHALYKVVANTGFIVRIFFYDDLGSFLSQSTIDVTQGYIIPNTANAKYIRFSIQKTDTSADISPTDNVGLKLYGFNDYREDELNDNNTRNFIRLNENNLPILASCFAPDNYAIGKTDFSSFVVTDLHGDFTSLGDTKTAKQYLRSVPKFSSKTIACICCGDICQGTPKWNGNVAPEIAEYMSYAEDLAIYHCMGQHEVGFYDTESGRAKANCFSHQEVFDTFISPMKSVWGLPNLDTIYYYKDIEDSNVRIISLYQFNIPLVDDPSDNSLYKYWRCAIWYGQDQIDWLIQTLNSTPSNYKVIILMHEPEANVLPTPKKLFFTGSSVKGGNIIINGTPIYDIVSAYVAKTTLLQSYVCNNTAKYPTSDFTLNVNADFSEANGDFACFMTGDAHIDYMGVIENTSLVNIGMTATSNQTYDFTLYRKPGKRAIWNGNNIATSIVRCIGFYHSSNGGLIKVGGLGQQYSNTGEYRNYGVINY